MKKKASAKGKPALKPPLKPLVNPNRSSPYIPTFVTSETGQGPKAGPVLRSRQKVEIARREGLKVSRVGPLVTDPKNPGNKSLWRRRWKLRAGDGIGGGTSIG